MKTKIYGTIGPACCDTEMLVHLFEKGMTGIRINLSHADLEEADAWISGIHSAWSRLHDGTPEILIDLRGPELRIGTLGAERLLKEGDGLSLVADKTICLIRRRFRCRERCLWRLRPDRRFCWTTAGLH